VNLRIELLEDGSFVLHVLDGPREVFAQPGNTHCFADWEAMRTWLDARFGHAV